MADLKTNLLGFTMNSPIIGASGTVGYGVEYEELADFSKIGGISGKGLTLHGQYGNKGERLWETPSGLINSIGLQNPGVQHFIDVELGEMLELKQKYGTVAIANLGGHSEEEYVEGAALLSESGVDIVELNISCPNVKVGGMAYGVKAEAAGEVVRMVRDACKKPLMVKLSPQAENIPEMCKAVEAAGADAISLPEKSKPPNLFPEFTAKKKATIFRLLPCSSLYLNTLYHRPSVSFYIILKFFSAFECFRCTCAHSYPVFLQISFHLIRSM